jgi:aryl-alcohol dehydrogenase-like predicted oxidoreductase
MERIRLGRTGLTVGRTAFGAIPIQRVSFDEARAILRGAYEGGINFYDTARAYGDSEEKIGYALSDMRKSIFLATKSTATGRADLLENLQTSLRNLRTDYVDILQLHNPPTVGDPNDANSALAGLMEARAKGMVRFIGITSHRLSVAVEAARSGLFDTVQFPICAISSDEDLRLPEICRQQDVGLIAMKALCGGLLTDAAPAFAFLRRFENVVPIWGIQRLDELEQLLALEIDPPELGPEMLQTIERLKAELGGDFCRACGYCLPCAAEIPIPQAARMSFLLRRMPAAAFLSPQWREQMDRIKACTNCGLCTQRCPYHLDTPALLKKMYGEYQTHL